MPITPRYSLTQTSSHLQIEVSIPHVRVSTSTLELRIVDGTEVNLYAPPTYLLRLTLPGRVIDEDAVEDSLSNSSIIGLNCNCPIIQEEDGEDGELQPKVSVQKLLTKDDLPKLQYNPEKNHGTLVIILQKEEEGFWEDLDLLGRLQQPSHSRQMKRATNNPLIQEINENGDVESRSNSDVVNNVMEDCLSVQKTMSYGLFKDYSNVFRDYAREGLVHEMLECPNPDEIISNGDDDIVLEEQYRRELRLQMENEKFDEDRYINDLHIEHECDMVFDAAVSMKPHWIEDNNNRDGSQSDGNQFFSSEESHLLAEIPRHTNTPMNLSVEQQKSGLLCLVDILFAYVYDHRTTDGDPTVESSWTVMILSPTLSWLEHYNPPYDTLDNVLQWSIRRSLIYPYLRSYNLAKLIAEDVSRILKCGRRTVIRCLLQLHKIMEQSESHYLFNKLYIDPMIGWVQQCKENEVQQFGIEVEELCKSSDDDVLGKQCLGLDLVGTEERFFENTREISSSDDDDDSSCSVDYESDDESGGDTEEVTTDEEVAKTSTEHKHSSALLDENIVGHQESRLIDVMEKLVVDE
jgi:protein SHQ1